MAYSLQNPASAHSDLTAKNRVRGIFANPNNSRLANRRNPAQPRRKIRPTATKPASGIPVWPSRDPIEEMGGVNLYGFVKNNGLINVDLLGRSTFWDVFSTLPFFGTLYNIIVSPAGSHVVDYKIVIDSTMCDLDPDQAVADCKNNVGTQQARYIAKYSALNIGHEVLDGFGSISPIAPAFWIDAAVDFFVSLYKISRIIDAADSAKLKCVCASCPKKDE